ncbi:MAG: ATP-binding cassette domain-containing protein [Acidimicrobiia bacterium]|jgi:teichoic acid transport system ATP-binding protein
MTAPVSISVRDLYLDYEISEDRRQALRERLVNHQGTGRRVVRALRGLSFDVTAGESVGVIGSNGSGKSTLLAALAGLLPPTSGDILVSAEPKLLGVGATLLPTATGWKNIRIGCMALGMTADEVEEHIEEIGKFTDLGEALDRPLHTYSSGMRARLHFAVATSVEPEILLIDEALAVGDEAFKRKSADRIEKLLARAGTLVFVSHSLGDVMQRCNRVLWVEQGRLRADGDPEAVTEKYMAFVG